MKIKKLLFYLSFIILLTIDFACQKKAEILNEDKPVAKVYDKYLMMNEIEQIIPKNTSPEDSIVLVENYINRWIKKQLLVYMSEEYLDEQEKKEIEKKVETFRNSLLIHTLKNKIIYDKLDTTISLDEIRQYYERHKQDFILSNSIVQGYLIKIPLEKTNVIEEIKQLVNYNLPHNISKVQEILKQNNGLFINFTSQWQDFSEITSYLPFYINNDKYFLENKRVLETTDDRYYYYLRITQFLLQGETMPLDLTQDRIKKILLNKKTESIIKDLENTLYTEGIKKGKVKIFY